VKAGKQMAMVSMALSVNNPTFPNRCQINRL